MNKYNHGFKADRERNIRDSLKGENAALRAKVAHLEGNADAHMQLLKDTEAKAAMLETALLAAYEVLLYQSARTRQAREWLPKDYAVIDAVQAVVANYPDAAQKIGAARDAWWKGNMVARHAEDALAGTEGEG